jgi:streptogramin lyase
MALHRTLLAVVVFAAFSPLLRAQGRTEVTVNDPGIQAENLTSSQDGGVYFGSTAKGTIYRAAPGASQAEAWIQASTAGLTNVLGVLADDKSNTLWVCQNSTGGRGGAPAVGQTALRSFDLKTGAAKGTYPFPSNGGVCNDMAIAADGTVYVTESFANLYGAFTRSGHATRSYSCKSPPSRSRRFTVIGCGPVHVILTADHSAAPSPGCDEVATRCSGQ